MLHFIHHLASSIATVGGTVAAAAARAAELPLPRAGAGNNLIWAGLGLAAAAALLWRVARRRGIGRSEIAERALAELAQALIASRSEEEVIDHALQVVENALDSAVAVMLRRREGNHFQAAGRGGGDGRQAALPPHLMTRLDRGQVLRSEDLRAAAGPRAAKSPFPEAQLVVPICGRSCAAGVLLLRPQGRVRAYERRQIELASAMASLLGLGLARAVASDEAATLARRNQDLGKRLHQQTLVEESTGAELSRSLTQLQEAYAELEQSHANLQRADRLATLGQLTAGLAHEINTPLSAVLNSLKIIADLGREYGSSIDDPSVESQDHHQIAEEIGSNAEAAIQWTRKATSFIRSVKCHGRDPGTAGEEEFPVREVVAQTLELIEHRIQASSCRVDYTEEGENICLLGNPGRFNQVLVNLITNAIDAYEDSGTVDGRIEVCARRTAEGIDIMVRDWAGGIPSAVLPRVFEGLFTTKSSGRGTGLGLWIARNVVEEGFGGVLDVFTTPGLGSCFTASFPGPNQPCPAALSSFAGQAAEDIPEGLPLPFEPLGEGAGRSPTHVAL